MISVLRTALIFPLVLFAAVTTSTPAYPYQSTETVPPSHSSPARKSPLKGIPNFGQVTPTLYRGAQPTQEGIEALKKMDVDIVVDLRAGNRESEKQAVAKLGMRYVSLPSQCYSPKDETFAGFLAVVRENPGKKIFVHCKLGEDRTGMAIASYRMAEQGWSADEAMKEMQSFGFSTTHHLTCSGLAGYEKKFPERWKTSVAFERLRVERSEESK